MLMCLGKKILGRMRRHLGRSSSVAPARAPEAASLAPPCARGSQARPGRRRARRNPVPAWFLLTPFFFLVTPLCFSWCACCWERGWLRRSHIHRSHTSGSPARRWNPSCGASTRGTSRPMASLPSQRHRCPTLATPSPSGAPPFPTSMSSEEVQKILNPATASSVQLSHASFRMHNTFTQQRTDLLAER
jgi:hypothetical protein